MGRLQYLNEITCEVSDLDHFLHSLSTYKIIDESNFLLKLEELNERLADILELDYLSFWNFEKVQLKNSEILTCQDYYEKAHQRHSIFNSIEITKFPIYLKFLHNNPIFSCSNAEQEPILFGFYNSYLKSRNIQSIIQSIVWMNGKPVSLISGEIVGISRNFTVREKNWINLASLIIANWQYQLNNLNQDNDRSTKKNDISELSTQKAFFKSIIDASPNFVFAKDRFGKFVLANKAVADAYGTTEKNLIGKTDADFNHSKDEIEKFLADDLYVIENGREIIIHDEKVTDSKGEVRYLYTVKRPLFCEEISDTLVLGISTDITARKKAEEEYKDWLHKLEHSQKLESLGLLASGIAHDFNNILQGVIGNTSLAREIMPKDSEQKKLVTKALKSAQKAAEITSQLLSYSGNAPLEKKKIELSYVVQDTISLIERITTKKVDIHCNLSIDPLIIYADLPKIRQIILNLLTNAIESIDKKIGYIKINTKKLNQSYVVEYFKQSDLEQSQITENYAAVEIIDNGCGIPEDTLLRIFEPFYSTKLAGRGIGLAAVQGIIKSHSGFLNVKSEVGVGSKFTVIFPLQSHTTNICETSGNSYNQPDSISFNEKNLKILVIDDETISREVCQSMLDFLNIKSDLAENGQNGINIFEQDPKRYHAIILDITMPKLDGLEVYKIIRERSKEIPILFSSGFSLSQVSKDLNTFENTYFLEKPFTMKQLKLSLAKLFS